MSERRRARGKAECRERGQGLIEIGGRRERWMGGWVGGREMGKGE